MLRLPDEYESGALLRVPFLVSLARDVKYPLLFSLPLTVHFPDEGVQLPDWLIPDCSRNHALARAGLAYGR